MDRRTASKCMGAAAVGAATQGAMEQASAEPVELHRSQSLQRRAVRVKGSGAEQTGVLDETERLLQAIGQVAGHGVRQEPLRGCAKQFETPPVEVHGSGDDAQQQEYGPNPQASCPPEETQPHHATDPAP